MTPLEVAELIPDLIKKREESEGKPITRFQLSNKSLASLSQRTIITSQFIDTLCSEILEHGWCCFQVTSSSYGFIKLSTAQNFRRLNSERLIDYT